MNDKDKEEFDKWVKSEDTRMHPEGREGYFANNNNFTRDYWIAERTWQAACEYKDEEIDELTSVLDLKKETLLECAHNYYSLMEELKEYKEAARSEANIVNELQAENKKLREALEQIAYHVGKFPIHESYCELSHIAREALKEVEKK